LVRERTATAPARPAKAAPPASNGVFARWATDATVRPADPTLLAPVDAVSLTVSPTDPSVLRPLRERDCDCDRERLCDRGFALFDDEDRPDEDRPRDELLLLAEPRELLLLLLLAELLLADPRELLLLLDEPRELAVLLRPFVLVCRDFDVPLVPFRVVLLERLDARRLPVLDFACAMWLLPFSHSEQNPAPVPGAQQLPE
jgi:hypothetical protein